MITYNKLAEQFILYASGGDKSRDSELEFPDVVLVARQAVSELVKLEIFTDSKSEGNLDAQFHYVRPEKNIDVVWDNTNCECYAIIPDVPLSIPGNRGIKEVGPNTNQGKSFYPIKSGQYSMYAEILEENDVVYWPEGNKVIFHKNIKNKHSKVAMRLIVAAPSSLDADADFFLPDDIQASVLDRMKQMLMPEQPQDKINNANKSI
jgi:hypothetical protein